MKGMSTYNKIFPDTLTGGVRYVEKKLLLSYIKKIKIPRGWFIKERRMVLCKGVFPCLRKCDENLKIIPSHMLGKTLILLAYNWMKDIIII